MAQRLSAEFLLGSILVAVWGVELLKAVSGLLTAPLEIAESSGVIRDYLEYARIWVIVRCAICAVGVVAGIMICRHRRLGHWLSVVSAVILLGFATDFHWYSAWLFGELSSSPWRFFVVVPGLAYGVLVFPIIVAALLATSTAVLFRRRKQYAATSAI